jgi:hypothetical protein
MFILSIRKNTVLQGAFKLNSALAVAETQHLKGHTLQVRLRRDGIDVYHGRNMKCIENLREK